MNVLVPIDGSKHSSEGLRVASHFAKANKARIFVVNVIPSVADIDLELSASDLPRLHEALHEETLRHADDTDLVAALVALVSLLPVLAGTGEELVDRPIEVRDLRGPVTVVIVVVVWLLPLSVGFVTTRFRL